MSSGRLDQVWAVLLHYEKMKRGEAKAISSMLNIHYFSIDPSLQTEIVPMIPVSKLGKINPSSQTGIPVRELGRCAFWD